MTRPVVSGFTEYVYAKLPAVLRTADEALGDGDDGYPLLRYLSLVVDQVANVPALYERLDYVPYRDGGAGDDHSDLVHPNFVDDAWKPWLAQLLGVADDDPEMSLDALLILAPEQRRRGTEAAIASLVRGAGDFGLTGTQFVDVGPRIVAGATVPHVMVIKTRESETPGPTTSAVIVAAAEPQRPAGHVFEHELIVGA